MRAPLRSKPRGRVPGIGAWLVRACAAPAHQSERVPHRRTRAVNRRARPATRAASVSCRARATAAERLGGGQRRRRARGGRGRRRGGRATCAPCEGPASCAAGRRSAAPDGACRRSRDRAPRATAPWHPRSPRPCGVRGGRRRDQAGSGRGHEPRARGSSRRGRACARCHVRGLWRGRSPSGPRRPGDGGAPPRGRRGPRARLSAPAASWLFPKACRRRPGWRQPSMAGRRRRRP